MGKMKVIHNDDGSLVEAPKGFDSILAQGNQEPDPKEDTEIKIDGKSVLVPQVSFAP